LTISHSMDMLSATIGPGVGCGSGNRCKCLCYIMLRLSSGSGICIALSKGAVTWLGGRAMFRGHINRTGMTQKPGAGAGSGLTGTFRETLLQTASAAARLAWQRARQASVLRKAALRSGNCRVAVRLSALKIRAVLRALEFAPDLISIGIDNDWEVGLLSISFPGQGRLHLPKGALGSGRKGFARPLRSDVAGGGRAMSAIRGDGPKKGPAEMSHEHN